jgi:hypothetical protein
MRKFCLEGGFAMSSFTELIQIFDDDVEDVGGGDKTITF